MKSIRALFTLGALLGLNGIAFGATIRLLSDAEVSAAAIVASKENRSWDEKKRNKKDTWYRAVWI